MKNIKKYFICLITVFICMAASACGSKRVEVQEINASFVRGYGNIAALAENSNKIAVVKVLDSGRCEKIEGLPCTINQVEVVSPLYGCEQGEVISHLTPGGTMDNVKTVANGVLQLEKGNTYLLFMAQEGAGHYIDLNYDEGRLIMENGLLTSAKYDPAYKQRNTNSIYGMKDYPMEAVVETINKTLLQPELLGGKPHEYSSLDFPITKYTDWETLLNDSDVVCVISVDSFIPQDFPNGIENSSFRAAVDSVYYGNLLDEVIQIHTMNVELTDMRYEVIDDPWMNNGEQYLVFLSECGDEGYYDVTGYAQGRFELSDGLLTALKYRFPSRVTLGLDVQDLPLADFEIILEEINN